MFWIYFFFLTFIVETFITSRLSLFFFHICWCFCQERPLKRWQAIELHLHTTVLINRRFVELMLNLWPFLFFPAPWCLFKSHSNDFGQLNLSVRVCFLFIFLKPTCVPSGFNLILNLWVAWKKYVLFSINEKTINLFENVWTWASMKNVNFKIYE